MTAPPTYAIDAAVARNVVQGDRNEVHFGADYRGMIVQVVAAPPAPPRPATPPVRMRPPRIDNLVGREEQAGDVLREFRRSQVVQVVGPRGIGKTALLRHLCWRTEIAGPGEGIVFKEQRDEPLEDLLQFLFECFYDSEPPVKPVGGRLRRYLQDVAAVIVIDDSRLDREDRETLRNHLPLCPLLAASDRQRWFDEGAVALGGLSLAASRALFEGTLGRPLTPDEEPAANALIAALAGVPGHVRQAALLVTRDAEGLSPLAEAVGAGGAAQLARACVAALPVAEREIARTMSALDDTPMPQGWGPRSLASLVNRALAEAHSPSYTLAGNVSDVLREEMDPAALERVVAWTRELTITGSPPAPEDVELAAASARLAARAGRWEEALELTRSVEPILLVTGRWGRCQQLLTDAAEGARRLGDRAALGWSLHDLGSIALCREQYQQAGRLLREALRERDAAGDRAGVERTRANLRVLRRLTGGPPPAWAILVLLLAVLGLGAAVVLHPGVAGLPWPLVATASPTSATSHSLEHTTSPTPSAPPSLPSTRPPSPIPPSGSSARPSPSVPVSVPPPARFTLKVTVTGTGKGPITISGGGEKPISCNVGSTCGQAYEPQVTVSIVSPSPAVWSPLCPKDVTTKCSLTMTADTSVTVDIRPG